MATATATDSVSRHELPATIRCNAPEVEQVSKILVRTKTAGWAWADRVPENKTAEVTKATEKQRQARFGTNGKFAVEPEGTLLRFSPTIEVLLTYDGNFSLECSDLTEAVRKALIHIAEELTPGLAIVAWEKAAALRQARNYKTGISV